MTHTAPWTNEDCEIILGCIDGAALNMIACDSDETRFHLDSARVADAVSGMINSVMEWGEDQLWYQVY